MSDTSMTGAYVHQIVQLYLCVCLTVDIALCDVGGLCIQDSNVAACSLKSPTTLCTMEILHWFRCAIALFPRRGRWVYFAHASFVAGSISAPVAEGSRATGPTAGVEHGNRARGEREIGQGPQTEAAERSTRCPCPQTTGSSSGARTLQHVYRTGVEGTRPHARVRACVSVCVCASTSTHSRLNITHTISTDTRFLMC